MVNTLDEGMLIRHMDLRRVARTSGDAPFQLAIQVEHMDGTNYMVSVVDKRGTSEYSTTLLATVVRGANLMFRALDVLRTVGYVDVHPIALAGREIVFGLDRVTLELEIIENRIGEIDCGISVTSVDPGKAEEIGGVLEENGIDVV